MKKEKGRRWDKLIRIFKSRVSDKKYRESFDEIFGLKEHTLELEIQDYQQSLANKRSRNERKNKKSNRQM